MQNFSKQDYQRLVTELETGALAPDQFSHLNHLRAAAFYFLESGYQAGLQRVSDAIRQYAAQIGAEQKFHATLTYGFYRLVVEALSSKVASESPWEMVDSLVQSLMTTVNRAAVVEHYSEFTLASDAARESIVLPDKKPFASDSVYEPEPYRLEQGCVPVLISMPHNGTLIPEDISANMTEAGRSTADTDWFLRLLYDFIRTEGCYFITPKYSRYVIDLNRPADGAELYPGANNTELCPTTTFALEPIYQRGKEPSKQAQHARVESIWRPYHNAIKRTLEQLKASYGQAILLEAHSIASEVPRFFDGVLPDFNFGTNDGKSCSSELACAIESFSTEDYSKVINGRFKGGYITRFFGQPNDGVSALQLELSQRCYMDETSLSYCPERAGRVIPVLQNLIVQLKQLVIR